MNKKTPTVQKVFGMSIAFAILSLTQAGAQTTLAQWTLSYPTGTVSSVTSTGANATTLTAPTGSEATGAMFGEYAGTNFDPTGSGDYLASSGVVSYLNFAENSAFTIEAWVYSESLSTPGRTFFSNRTPTSIDPTLPGFSLIQRGTAAGSGAGQISFAFDYGPDSVSLNSSTVMSLNAWHHVAVERTESGQFILYLDGSVVAQSGTGYTMSITSTGDTYIGRMGNTGATTNMWDGGINVVKVTDAALSPSSFIGLQAAIPEPGQYVAGIGALGLALVLLRRRIR